MEHNLVNLNTDKANLSKQSIGYTLDYGRIAKGSDSQIKLLLSIGKIEDIKISSSCGCTASSMKQEGEDYVISITYDTNRTGEFEKTVRIDFTKNKVKSRLQIAVKGKVI